MGWLKLERRSSRRAGRIRSGGEAFATGLRLVAASILALHTALAFAAHRGLLGYSLALEVPAGRLELRGRAAFFPHRLLPASAAGDCGASYPGGRPPNLGEVLAATACLSARAPVIARFGPGLAIPLSSRLRFTPAVYALGLWIPDVLLETDSTVLRQDLLTLGLEASGGLSWAVTRGPIALAVELEAEGGISFARSTVDDVWATPIGVSAGISATF